MLNHIVFLKVKPWYLYCSNEKEALEFWQDQIDNADFDEYCDD